MVVISSFSISPPVASEDFKYGISQELFCNGVVLGINVSAVSVYNLCAKLSTSLYQYDLSHYSILKFLSQN